MAESKYTPGPWVQSGVSIMSETPLRLIAVIGAPSERTDEDAYNARLIAAAPDLLEALKILHAHIFGPTTAMLRHEIDDKCRAAIANAEGQS